MLTNYKIAAMVPLIIAAVLFFGAIALNVTLIRRWRGLWRAIACLPILALMIWTGVIIISIMLDPSSHNLWPLELVLWSFAALVTLGVITIVKYFFVKE